MSPIFIPPGSPITAWGVQLDPPAVATARTALDLNVDPVRVDQKGIDWGQAAITAYMAQQSKYGSAPADFIVPNRTVTIPLFLGTGSYPSQEAAIVGEENARARLQQKVGLLQREGGFLVRQRAGGPAMYADVVNATLTLPDILGETGGIEPDVSLVLECLPDFYGDEVSLDTVTGTNVCQTVLKQSGANAVIPGDHFARGRIIVTDTSGNDQKSVLWGLRSKHYDPSTEAQLFYEAEAMTPLNGAASTTLAGASGGHVVSIASLPAGSWVAILSTNDAPLTHTGSYRVWVRAYSATAAPQLRLLWGVGSLSVPVTNDSVVLPGSGAFYLLDLGTVRLDAPPVGVNQWFGAIQVLAAHVGDPVSIDCVYFQPLDDGAGQLTYVNEPPASVIEASASPTAVANDAANGGTLTWSNPTNAEVQDTTCASVAVSASNLSETLKCTGYGFVIPGGATIQGVQVTIVWKVGSGGFAFEDAFPYLVKAGTVQLSTTWHVATNVGGGLSFTTTTYGGPTDTAGLTLTGSDVNNSGFGAAIETGGGGIGSGTVLVDYVEMTVWYTLASGFTIAQDAVVYANETCEARWDTMVRTADGTVYGPVSQVVGDLVRIPPSGIENRPVQLFVKPSRGDTGPVADSGLDGYSIQVKYRPSWLFRP